MIFFTMHPLIIYFALIWWYKYYYGSSPRIMYFGTGELIKYLQYFVGVTEYDIEVDFGSRGEGEFISLLNQVSYSVVTCEVLDILC